MVSELEGRSVHDCPLDLTVDDRALDGESVFFSTQLGSSHGSIELIHLLEFGYIGQLGRNLIISEGDNSVWGNSEGFLWGVGAELDIDVCNGKFI